MKNNWKLLYNPFDRIAGWRAFAVGLPIVCLSVVLGWLTDTASFGLEVKTGGGLSLLQMFAYTGLGLVCTVGVMYVVGLIFSKGVRFQDILGTVTLARAPYILSPVLGIIAGVSRLDTSNPTMDPEAINWSAMIGIAVFATLVTVWAVAMLYNAFRVSTDLKGAKCTILFILSLLISEIIMLAILW